MDYKDSQIGHIKENFWFKAKINLVKILMLKTCNGKNSLRILNIGVGTGDDLEILNKFGKNYVIDINKDALAIINNNLCVEKKFADARDLPYDDNFFDVAVAFDVFEHIKEEHVAINEVYRVLKQDGVLIFTVPAFQFLFSSHDKALRHHRRYNKKGLMNLLTPFNGLKIYYWNSLLFMPMAITRILKKESKPKVDQINLPFWLNIFLYGLLSIDNLLIKINISMPIGLSIVGFCYKQT